MPPFDVSYPTTTDYYWGTIQNNMTDVHGMPDNYATTDGPFGFGYAVSISSDEEQCLMEENYNSQNDPCPTNPSLCQSGFSVSVWFKTVFPADFLTRNVAYTEADDKYILSTGGDENGHPGYGIYFRGFNLVAVVSTGDKFWKTVVPAPVANATWTNIAIRWERPNSASTGRTVDEFSGGLEVYVNLEKVGHTVLEETSTSKQALDPSMLMIGCHKTNTTNVYRGFNDAEFDELASWSRKLPNNQTVFFFGGFEANFSNIKADEFKTMLERVDLSNPLQRAAAVNIATKLTAEEPVPTVPPVSSSSATGTASSSSGSSSQGTASSPTATAAASTAEPPSDEEVKKHKTLVEILDMLTDTDGLPQELDRADLSSMMTTIDPFSNALSPSNMDKWKEFTRQQRKDQPGIVKVKDDLENWMMGVVKVVKFENGSEPLYETKGTDSIVAQTAKMTVDNFNDRSFYEFPVYNNLPGVRNKWNLPYDRFAVPTNVFSDSRCEERPLNIVSMLYDTYDDLVPVKVNPANLNGYAEHVIDSRVISFNVECDQKLDAMGFVDPTAPACTPDKELMMENPIRYKMENNVKSVSLRRLNFHSNETVTEIRRRICVWWNSLVSDYGAWDSSGCKVLDSTSEFTKCACGQYGTFAVLAEKVEPREVPDEQTWLIITKYIGHVLSFIALIIFIVVIAVSGDLKEQFHLIGLNLALAIFLGAVFMLVSDIHGIRDDRHICTAIGTLIHFFYLGAGAWCFVLGHASFKAITSGVISGRLRPYWFLAWSVPVISVGLTYLIFLYDLGLDPRCFISWVNEPKYVFFGPMMFFCVLSFIFGTIVLCNMSTPALRKDNLIDDYGSFCHGASFVLIFFSITWTFGLLTYLRLGFREPDFYPIFQVFNSWMGLIIFLFIGLGSKRFRMILAGQAKLRRQMLFGNAFGKPGVPVEDREHLGSPQDQRSKSSSLPSSGRTSPLSPSGVNVNQAPTTARDFPRPHSQVAGRPGSRPSSGF